MAISNQTVGKGIRNHSFRGSFPVIAKRSGVLFVIVNRDPTPLDDLADFVHNGAIGEFFLLLRPLLNDG